MLQQHTEGHVGKDLTCYTKNFVLYATGNGNLKNEMLKFLLQKIIVERTNRRPLQDVLLRRIETNLQGENDKFILVTLSLRHRWATSRWKQAKTDWKQLDTKIWSWEEKPGSETGIFIQYVTEAIGIDGMTQGEGTEWEKGPSSKSWGIPAFKGAEVE